MIEDWDEHEGKYWSRVVDKSNIDVLQIYPVNSATKHECELYGLPFDPDAKFALYFQHSDPCEVVIDSLHPDLESAMCAGDAWLEGA